VPAHLLGTLGDLLRSAILSQSHGLNRTVLAGLAKTARL